MVGNLDTTGTKHPTDVKDISQKTSPRIPITSEEKKMIEDSINLCNDSQFLDAEEFEKMHTKILDTCKNNPPLLFALHVAFQGHPMIVGGQVGGGELQGLAFKMKKILHTAGASNMV